ncbi:hypothetical protein QW060_27475 [Myroides ceti]|uniref:Uncharacterized protein n=1 Tax=Paenimyroides ceti TaxID=395087 RepID=A0ABT8D2K2_9FLAO|nr:hypothetical protein [Paenimyroides ceti]MDN3710536.1 hypothetical protein [Paenimyroides ceti]
MVLAITYTIFRRFGSWRLFGGVAAGIPEASIAGAIHLQLVSVYKFTKRALRFLSLRRAGMSKHKSFFLRTIISSCRTYSRIIGAIAVAFFHLFYLTHLLLLPVLWFL